MIALSTTEDPTSAKRTCLVPHRVAAVVLTYNSSEDLTPCLEGLLAQFGVDLRLIVVDNASRPEALAQMEATFLEKVPDGVVLDAVDVTPERLDQIHAVFVRNDRNAGYSAGNNIGARIAADLQCAAILVINPDVRITSPNYVRSMADRLFADPAHVVGASAMLNLSGKDENPMGELSFTRELLLPVAMIGALFGIRLTGASPSKQAERPIEKVSGCCFLIRTDFLQKQGYFDEGVFLYCEEAILAKQVRMAGGSMIYCPDIDAIHAHRKSAKGDPVRRQVLWSRSRRYYHARYSGYGLPAKIALAASHRLVITLTWLLSKIGRSAE